MAKKAGTQPHGKRGAGRDTLYHCLRESTDEIQKTDGKQRQNEKQKRMEDKGLVNHINIKKE